MGLSRERRVGRRGTAGLGQMRAHGMEPRVEGSPVAGEARPPVRTTSLSLSLGQLALSCPPPVLIPCTRDAKGAEMPTAPGSKAQACSCRSWLQAALAQRNWPGPRALLREPQKEREPLGNFNH